MHLFSVLVVVNVEVRVVVGEVISDVDLVVLVDVLDVLVVVNVEVRVVVGEVISDVDLVVLVDV